MLLPEPLNSVDLQPFLDNPAQLASQTSHLQLAIANYPATGRHLLEILTRSNDPQVAQAARLHVNWAGEITDSWQESLDAQLQNARLGHNDRLAVELLKFAPVPDCFFSEWVPAERFIEALRNPYLPLRYRLKLLENLAKKTNNRTAVASSGIARNAASSIGRISWRFRNTDSLGGEGEL